MESTNYTLYLLFYAGISNALVLTFQIQTISDKFGLESSIILLIIWHHSFLSSTENIAIKRYNKTWIYQIHEVILCSLAISNIPSQIENIKYNL